MRKTLLKLLLIPALLLLPAATFSAPAYACGSSSAAQKVSEGIDGATGATCNDSGIQTAISTAVTILSIIVGIAAIIVIILSGFKYITSGGDAAKVGNAKNTLIYAMVGLAVAALAQLLVHFILFQSNQATLPDCPPGHPAPTCRS